MKIRSGFVSNSSSSSFVGWTTPQEHKKALEKLSPKEKDFIQTLPFPITHKFGMNFVELICEQYEDAGSIQGIQIEDLVGETPEGWTDWDEAEELYLIFDKYVKQLGEALTYEEYR